MTTIARTTAFLAVCVSAQAQLATPGPSGVVMGHVHINARDIGVQKAFWTKYFGATELSRAGLDGVKMPGMLILFSAKPASGGSEGTSMDHFGVKVPSTSDVVKRCRDGGIPVQREFKGTEGFPNAYLIGPDDVKIELQEETSLKQPAIAYHLHFINAPGDHIKLRDWYAANLGAVVKMRGSHEAADVPGMNLTFGTAKAAPGIGTKGRSIDHIGFEVKNLKALCKRLDAKGVKFDVPYRKIPKAGLAVAFLTDPYGTYVELTEGLDKY